MPDYEALSYTWGDNTSKTSLCIDGKGFVAFGNAYDALIELRKPTAGRRIWIDAICINQDDIKEKQHQILLMKLVYEKATQVVVWLSRPRSDADLAVALLDELHIQQDDGTATIQDVLSIHRPRMRNPEWTALRDFLHHPWWRRVWCFQEAIAGADIVFQFGRHTIPWERLHLLGDDNKLLYGMFIKESGEGLDFGVGQPDGCSAIPIIQWLRDVIERGEKPSLLDLLLQCWFRKATNSRDYIYGLCALSSDIESLDIHPNYALLVEEVFTDAVTKILLKYGTLELFCKAGCGFDRKLSNLPSYVPDWTNIPGAQPLFWHFYEGAQTIAPKNRAISLHQSGTLQTKIYKLSTIEQVSKPLIGAGEGNESIQILSWLDKAENMAFMGARDQYPMTAPSGPSITLFNAFWRTTIANSSGNRTEAPEDWCQGYLRYKWTLSVQCGISPKSLFSDLEQYEDQYRDPMDHTMARMADWYNAMLITSWERAFCVTSNGMLGLVPPKAAPGDLVCLIPGGAVPYVMRPKRSSGSQEEYELVGESYFHGVTAISAMEEFRSNGQEPYTVFLV